MLLLGKSPDDIDAAHLQRLVTIGVAEGDRLEYKRDMYGRDDASRRELLRDVTAMANHRGGHLLIGVDEDEDGTARAIMGVAPGDHAEWIRNLCLSSIEERIIGLNVFDHVTLADGTVVVIIDVPESPNAPHMVTFKGLNQFWKRHGRQKAEMSVDEIRDGFLRVLDARGRIERLVQRRRSELHEASEGQCLMVLSAFPASFRDEAMVDTRDPFVRTLMEMPPSAAFANTSTIGCGPSFPTLEGARAEMHRPANHLEIWRNGYTEFVTAIEVQEPPLRLYYAAQAHTWYIIDFVAFIAELYGRLLPGSPVAVRLAFYNAKEMGLPPLRLWPGDEMPRWPRVDLGLGELLVENLEQERQMLPKRICDRLWNAFHYEESHVFDATGALQRA